MPISTKAACRLASIETIRLYRYYSWFARAPPC
ncbi:hypothetical protein H206_05331 [Candidatus Electrothrix aarhusensis]|uniref:Uncharacterized protein n=1 Tax=Candidatus Electrothrix aarhusensis TaxID=1859131 RepID=A0A3S3SR01_9BACT|nr:hypothetical protein H206_05331 [Candidatus Electrothrix aarhusensis]